MPYYINLNEFSIEAFKEKLKDMELIPSWEIIGEDVDESFDKIKKQGVENLQDLLTALKTSEKIQEFSCVSGLTIKYLSVLNRVVKGYKQKPNRLRDFPNIDANVLMRLEANHLNNTLKLYEKVLTPEKRKQLADNTRIDISEILKVAMFSDLSRIRWVNHTFAYVLLEAGYNSAEKVAKANAQSLYEEIKQLNAERKIYNASIGVRDMKMVIDFAQDLEFELQVVNND